jgi:hypothetical protein
MLKINRGTLYRQFQKFSEGVLSNGRPSVFTPEEAFLINEFINQGFSQNRPVSFAEIWDFIQETFGKSILMDTLRHFIHSLPSVKIIRGIPMDAERVDCDHAAIDAFYEELARYFQDDIPSSFVLNVDETGIQEFVDARELSVVVPIEFGDDSIFIGKKRSEKRISLLGGIFGDGTTLKPILVVPRETLDSEIIERGYPQKNVSIYSRDNGFIDTEIFDSWIAIILIPEIMRRRNSTGYIGAVILILDGCSVHYSEFFEDELLHAGIIPIYLTPHSSDQCQPLDLLVFALHKQFIHRIKIRAPLSVLSKQIIKILDGWVQATTPNNVISSFRRAGIVFREDLQDPSFPCYSRVCPSKAKSVRHFAGQVFEDSAEVPSHRLCTALFQ